MSYCTECGFYLDSDDCEMCDTRLAQVGTPPGARARERDARDERSPLATWWVTIAITPFLLLVFYALVAYETPFPYIAYTLTLVFYSMAIIFDLRYIRKATTGWSPRPLIWVWLASLNLLVGGLFTFIITPCYMYKRRNTEPVENDRA